MLAAAGPTSVASAQPEESRDDESAGHSRGGYTWGHEGGDEGGGPAVTVHRYGHVFGTLGAGATIRIIQYETLNQDRVAPPYLQLRAGYFFEGDGSLQHGALLGIATVLNPDGTVSFGVDAFGQWTLAPSYVLRWWLDGDLGDWLQVTGRLGVPLSFAPAPDGTYFSWGLEGALGIVATLLQGLGLYAEADISLYFSNGADPTSSVDVHPLVSFEGGIVVDYEVLP